MSTPAAMPSRRPWYREPMVLLVIAIPLSSVVMGAVLLWLSVSTYDGLVADDYYRRGLEINRVLDRDRAAARYGLSGELRLGPAGTRLLLEAEARDLELPARLTLDLSYATRAGRDRSVALTRVSYGEYAAPAPELVPGRWYLQLSADDWRITGEVMVPGAGRARLRPIPPAR